MADDWDIEGAAAPVLVEDQALLSMPEVCLV